MGRLQLPRFTGGLSTLVDPLVGDMSQSPNCANVRVDSGLLRQRPGYRVLDMEPSFSDGSNKGRAVLTFALASSQRASGESGAFADTAVKVKKWKMGTKWTVRFESAFAQSANATTVGNHTLFVVKGTTNDPVKLVAIGDGSAITLRLVVTDEDGNSVTIDTPNRTIATWTTSFSSRFIRITRDEGTVTLYVGETESWNDATLGTGQHESVTDVHLSHNGGAEHASQQFFGLAIVNRVMAEKEMWWGLSWPTDPDPEQDILINIPAIDATGTTLKDYSQYENDLDMTNTPTWSGEANAIARTLGMHTFRRRDGNKYHLMAFTRTGNDSTGEKPTGAVYAWRAVDAFFPFHIGGVSGNDDSTANLDGLSLFARMQFVTTGDRVMMMNGVDVARKYTGLSSLFIYMGMTAPAHAPIATPSASGGSMADGTYTYCYTFWNSVAGTESGRSPTVDATVSGGGGSGSVALTPFYQGDPQATHVRIYRTIAGGTTFRLVSTKTVSTAHTDTLADATITNNLLLAGEDRAGNLLVKRAYAIDSNEIRGAYTRAGAAGAPTFAADSSGGSVNAGAHYYAYSYVNSLTGEETGLSPLSAARTVSNPNNTVNLTGLVVPADTTFDQMRIYRTAAAGLTLKVVATATAATTYADTLADASLGDNLKEKGLPPKCKFAVMFANRLWMAGDKDNPGTVYWSTAGDYEAFPFSNSHIPNAGGEITGLAAVAGALLIHFRDGSIYALPHPGDEPDLSLFVPINMTQFSPYGATVGHFSIQNTPFGMIWLGRDGFYTIAGGGVQNFAPAITPTFLNLNRVRARYACSLYQDDVKTYRCWVSRGNNLLNEECFTLDLTTGAWTVDDIHADAAAVLLDAKENPHYCFGMELGILGEFHSDSYYQDGDGGGTTTFTVSTNGIRNIATASPALSNYTEPAGATGGYPILLVLANGTVNHRMALPDHLNAPGTGKGFYPSLSGLAASDTAHFNGIEGRWTTMKTDAGDARLEKNFVTMYVTHGKESAGDLKVEYAIDDGAFATANGSPVDLDDNMTSQVNIQKSGRFAQFRFTHSPPKANEPWKIVAVELEGDLAGDTA